MGLTSLFDFVVCQVFCIFVVWRNRIEGISKFTGSNAVFPAQVKIYVFLLPKFSFKHWWMLNGISKICQVSVFDWIIPSNKQETLYRLLYFCIRSLPSYRSRFRPSPAPVLPSSRPPVPLHLYFHWKYLTVPIQISHPSQARFKFPTHRARTTVKYPWVCRRGYVEASN